jgi:Carboxypeptidase regulatory-like domain
MVPNATVTLTDTASQETRTATSNSAGFYTFVNVPPGTYDITVTKAGFKKFRESAPARRSGKPTQSQSKIGARQDLATRAEFWYPNPKAG